LLEQVKRQKTSVLQNYLIFRLQQEFRSWNKKYCNQSYRGILRFEKVIFYEVQIEQVKVHNLLIQESYLFFWQYLLESEIVLNDMHQQVLVNLQQIRALEKLF